MPLDISVFDPIERLIVVAAHPDDLECMCGGTIFKLAQKGIKIFSVNCTTGDIGASDPATDQSTLAATRLREAAAAAKILGLHATFNLGHHDGELVPDLELRAQIARLYRLTRADTLFTFDPFWTGQIHPDHRAAGQAALDAYMPAKMPLYHSEQLVESDGALGKLERVFLFSTDREPDISVDITAVQHKKLDACMAHRTQFPQGEEDLQWLKELDATHGEKIDVAAAESFKTMRVW